MANGKKITKLVPCTFLLVIIACMLSNGLVEGRKMTELLVKHEGTVKTIESDDGDVIDCVDIYKQPAFDHPNLKNHTIQMRPSSSPRAMEPVNSTNQIVQRWSKYGECPDGTVPLIRRAQTNIVKKPAGPSEYAQVSQFRRNFGAYAKVNVWNPKVENGEYSAARVQVLAGNEIDLNSIEAGWMVNPDLFGDRQTRIYIYWTRDNYKSTGCYNFDCPGFVITSQKYVPGSALVPVSTYQGKQYEISIYIFKDKKTKNWWLKIQDVEVGYWPAEIFDRLRVNSAKRANWGGEIINKNSAVHHTTTQMGSGHFPNEEFGHSSMFHRIGYVDAIGITRDPENVQNFMTNPVYYTLYGVNIDTFYYGGPGYYGA